MSARPGSGEIPEILTDKKHLKFAVNLVSCGEADRSRHGNYYSGVVLVVGVITFILLSS